MPSRESLIVFLVAEADGPSAPTGVDKLPFAVVDLDGVPGMGAVFGWDWLARSKGGEARAFAVPTDDEGLEPGVGSNGSKKTGVTFADGKARCEGFSRS